MIQTGFEERVKIQQIIDSQLPEFVLDESPKTSEFLKQYYISQEYQGGPTDIVDNLDQYLNVDTLIPEVIVDNISLTDDINPTAKIILVTSTKGFPQKYGLLKIDDEIISYTGITTNTFTGCIRGFSGITNYHKELQYEELVFSESTASSHSSESQIKNLSSLFLREFYKKIKFSLSPGLEELEFTENLNVGNFIKEARTLYESKGTAESFRILFNVLFGETPKIIDLERFLIKPSDANYIRREVAVIDVISGNASKLEGQTIKKSTDERTSASVSEVETITRKGKTYYKLNFFIGYDDSYPNVTGTFSITPSTKIIEDEIIPFSNDNSSVISVDSTIGFPEYGSIFYNHPDYDDLVEIFYTQKSINQFFGCYTNLQKSITVSKTSNLISNETYYGYEDGDEDKKVEFRITGILSDLIIEDDNYNFFEGDEIYPQNVGEIVSNGTNIKQIFTDSWIYNTSSRYQVDSFSGNVITTKSTIDKSSLSVGDKIELLQKDTELKIPGFEDILVNSISNNDVTINVSTSTLSPLKNYDIRRKLKKASSIVPIEFGNNKVTSNIQNVYSENPDYVYVASNSLPSYLIQNNVFEYTATKLVEKNVEDDTFSAVELNNISSFITGDKVVYYTDQNSTIEGLDEGVYYVEVLRSDDLDIDRKRIRLYLSSSSIGSDNYLSFGKFSNGLVTGNHNFILYSQRSRTISPQKILKKFKLNQFDSISEKNDTIPGPIGILKNGVEIYNYKSNDKVYYGPIENVKVLNGGVGYDIINPPILNVSSGNALIQPVVIGSVEKVYVDPQEFDIDVVVSIALTGGNGSGAKFEPVIEKYSREIEFDARSISFGGGLDFFDERVVFTSNHNLVNGQEIIYNSNNNNELGIGLFNGSNLDQSKTLINTATYYPRIINDRTIELYQSYSDYISGINTVGFTTIGNSGIHKFKTNVKRKLSSIKVIDGGQGYSNRKLIVKPSGISTSNHTIEYIDHGFSDGEIVTYTYESNGISGLSTTNKYKILKIDSDKFRLCNAGADGNDISNYERKNYVKFSTIGTGYQIFSYPDIVLSIDYSSVGLESTQIKGSIDATPIIRGEISQVYVYEKGNDYGSTILNLHRRPQIIVKNGKESQFKPTIKNGRIIDVQVLYGGKEYYSTPDLIVSGNGVGALIRPIIENNKIVDVVVINPGSGYTSETTSVRAISAGRNAVFQSNIRPLTLNNSYRYGIQNINFRDPASEVLVESKNNLEYVVIGYSQSIKNNIGDSGNNDTHSDIIGWAYDGNPIYGSFGYSNPNDRTSIKKLESGYDIVNVENRPSTEIFPIGYFVEDYDYTGNGDLDQYNGRFGKTKDFPQGVYAYFTTTENNINANSVGKFPYFIGNSYRSQYLNENINLSQSFNFNNSKLLRNTNPYKVNNPYADNDFIIESNEIIEQKTLIESVSSGSVSSFEIIKSGTDYSVGDALLFDNDGVGEGISAEVSEVTGKEIVSIDTTIESYNDSVIEWENVNTVKIHISPYHNFSNKNNINISGLSTQVSNLNGSYQIGLTTYSAILDKDIPDYSITGIVTDIYVTSIPEKVSIGSSIRIENEIFSILNIYPSFNVLRVKRNPSGIVHTQTTIIDFLPNSLTVNKVTDYFESKVNTKVYYNPTKSIGIGITPGIGVSVDYSVGITTYNTFIPTQSIFLPNHPFTTNQQVIFRKPSGLNPIAVSNTPTSSAFNILNGDSEVLYVINKSKDYIGIVTSVGLTTNTNGLFLRSLGSDNFEYSIESNFTQVKAKVNKINSVVSVSTSHNLKTGDEIKLYVKPNLSVGIGTSSSIKVKVDSLSQKIVLNPISFNSSQINTLNNSITIYSHSLNTGDKIIYKALATIPTGLVNGSYFVYKIDNDNIKLCETYKDSVSITPRFVDIASSGSGTHQISIINPQIKPIKNNNLVFDLSDPSLIGYNFKIYLDKNFEKDFVSSPNSESFSVIGVGTIGISTTALLSLNYSDSVPQKLYYNLEKSGYINSVDTEVVNYSEISFVDSAYSGTHTVIGSGSTIFNIFLKQVPENLNYRQDDCDVLEYRTNSSTAFGGVGKIRLLNGGYGYKKLPLFNGINSQNGSGAFIIPSSNTIGKIKQSRIINEGFEYSSDKTLRPTASIPKLVYISASNTIDTIDILNGGQNYTSSPNLILVDSDTGELIESGLLKVSLSGSSITRVVVENEPKGLPTKPVTIKSINNSNGISIDKIDSSSSGIVTCILTTPISGFTAAPFAIGDKIFVEGIEKYDSSGDGFNSSDYGYQFFTVTNYDNLSPAKLEFNLSELSSNPGVAKTIQESYASIVNYKNYPLFNVTQKFSPFLIGEKISSDNGNGFIVRDLIVTNCEKNYIKVSGSYILSKNERIRGLESFSEASIDLVDNVNGVYNISYFNLQNFDWKSDTGKLSEDRQVIPDNNYYQNLSYSVKSTKTWEEIVTPVNNLLHTSGMKNFADMQILEKSDFGVETTESVASILNMYVSENRVDTISNFDLVVDVDTVADKSKFLKFKNINLADYILCKTNRVLKIDDISSEFSSNNDEKSLVSNILPINSGNGYNRFLVQIKNIKNNQTQFSEIVSINNQSDIYTLSKATITNVSDDYPLAEIKGYVDEDSKFYLRFEPKDPFNSNFNIKILQDTFISKSGVGSTQSVGFVDLISQNKIISSGITTSIFSLDASKYSSIYSNIHLLTNNSSDMNYVEIYITHDGTNTYISEYYFDDEDLESYELIGSFGASINNGILSLNYTNTSSKEIIVRSKNVGFGTTSVGDGFYRFKLPGQINTNERSVVFESKFTNISSGSTSVLVLDKTIFTSAKSIVKVGMGETSALHQIMTICDGTDSYITQYPFLSVGSTSGIGSFGSEISGNDFILKFYPDSSVSGNIEILSFNECFYTDLDTVNIPPDLVYSPVRQSVRVTKYFGINSPFADKLDFEAKYQDYPIFMKTFDPTDSTVLDPSTGIFTIQNHFFSTGERLIYTPKSTFIGIETFGMGIGATSNYVGVVTTILPSVVYAIKENNFSFRIATRKEYAEQGIGVTFTSYGSGNAHQFEMFKKNEKSLITINNLAQYPISYSNIDHTLSGNGGQISVASTIFALSGISSINPTDLLKIDDEYVKVENVGFGTTNTGPITFTGNVPLVEVTRGFVGSIPGIHTDTTNVSVYRGSYNISGNKIFFTHPPRGNQLDLIGPDEKNLKRERATFTGRVFLRQDYTSNQIYDDISNQFTGIGQTFVLTSQGINTIGLGDSGGNGIVFINSIFQSPTTLNNSNNNYFITEDTISGVSSVTFTGITSDDEIYTSDYDINMNQLPRGGIIVSLGSTSGLGYAPLVGASVTAVVGAGGSIVSVGLGTQDILGSGYRSPVSVSVTESGHSGNAASITAIVGLGGTLSFTVVDGGTGYSNPTINVSSPSYENLPVTGVSRLGIGTTTETGVGLLLNVEVGASSTSTGVGSTLFEVTSFKITRNGYGFKRGDVFKPVGLVTDKNLSSPINEFELTVLDTFTDSFGAWQFGELDYIDSIKNYQDGTRVRFPLFYNSELISFETDDDDSDSQLIDLDSVLLIFINGIPQEPGDSYQFSGGTSFTFKVAPKPEDNIAIFFYRGTVGEDSNLVNATESIKIGDTVKVFSNNNINNTITQNERTVYDISGADKIETNLYNSQGIDVDNEKPLYWTKQKVDLIINGESISKSRDSIESQVYPTANIIKDFNTTSSEIFVDDVRLFNYENQSPVNFDASIFTNNSGEYEILTNISDVEGFTASIVGIATTTGIGVPLAIKFTLSKDPFEFSDIEVGYPVYISGTTVGSGVTSINSNNSDVISISTSHLNNIYQVHSFDPITGIMTCNVSSNTSVVGIATTGTLKYPVGKLSWGRLSGFTRSSSPISIEVSGNMSSIGITSTGYGAGLSTYPIIQRRGYGLRNSGALVKITQ
jgi:hypothetical protein